MDEAPEVVEPPVEKKNHFNNLGKMVFSGLVGYIASEVAEKIYDELITKGKLKAMIKKRR